MGQNENIERIRNNPLKSKLDIQKLFLDMIEPLKDYYSEGCSLLKVGKTGTHYSKRIEWLEGFSRQLLGLIPYTLGGGDTKLWDIYVEGIRNGTNPEHPEYWGRADGGQMMVEMSPIGMALAMVPEKIWTKLSDKEKENLQSWLSQINNCSVGSNNWLFFRVFVNLGLKNVGARYDAHRLEEALILLDKCYLSDGWYSDGVTKQRDYYIPFAMHFFGLIYARLMEKDDPVRSKVFKERAGLFAKDFIKWFARNGASLPFGRSLTYRFAMGAFWSALAYANVESFSWGVIKGIVLRHLRWWMKQDIFGNDGILGIGYAYPNLKMAEFYNSPGSMNWAMKIFLVMALPDGHPFWKAEEEELPDLPDVNTQVHPYMLLCREKNRDHVFALTGGQHATWEPTFGAAKYGKFAYSSVFGFSVPAGEYGLVQGAYDSVLALCEHDELYRVRRTCEVIKVTNEYHYSLWKPWEDVQVETWLLPVVPWHIRVHKIVSNRELLAAEGGFASNNMNGNGDFEMDNTIEVGCASTVTPIGLSGIVNLKGDRIADIVLAAPNTNILYPTSAIPTLIGDIHKGQTVLISAVLGQPFSKGSEYDWDNCPQTELTDGVLKVKYRDCETSIILY